MTANGAWPRKRLKYLVDRKTQKASVERGSHYIGLENVEPWTGRYLRTEAEIETDSSQFRPGDVLFGKLRPYLAKVYVASAEGTCTSEMLVLRAREGVLARFLFYRLVSADFIDLVNSTTFGSKMPRADWEQIGNIVVSLPAPAEQALVASLLERETAHIDGLIAKKQRLIELLDEKRQALISRAVTLGLDPAAPMKDSGLEWLGGIPSHWEMVRLKETVHSIISGPFGSALTKDMYTSTGFRVYGQEQVIAGDFSVGDYFIAPEQFGSMNRYAVAPGDVLVSCVGTFGKVITVPPNIHPGIINPRLLRLRPRDEKLVPQYLCRVLSSHVGFTQMEQDSRGGTMDIINIGLLSRLRLPLPPKHEQAEILMGLDAETRNLDQLSEIYIRQLDRLREYRSALITAAVTGQLDLREHKKKMEALA